MSSGSTKLSSKSPPSPTTDLAAAAVNTLPTLSAATRLIPTIASAASGDNTKTAQYITTLSNFSSQSTVSSAREVGLPQNSKMSNTQQATDTGTFDEGKRSPSTDPGLLSSGGTGFAGGDRTDDVLSSASCGADSGIGPSSTATLSVGSSVNEPHQQHADNAGTSSSIPKIPLEPIVQLKKYTANDFKFIKTLGDGSFATVYLAKEIQSGRNYAVKVCEKRQILREKREAYIKREREVLSILNANSSPFFVKLFCTFQDASRLYFVITYAKNGELLTYIIKVNCFDAVCTQFYTAEVILALEHLHSLGIIHRDIKPENILLNEQMHILITDFGSAAIEGQPSAVEESRGRGSRRGPPSRQSSVKSIEDSIESSGSADGAALATSIPNLPGPPLTAVSDEDLAAQQQNEADSIRTRRRSFVGTADYVPPEMLTDKQSSRSTDLWALGCLVYQLLAGLPPFRAATDYHIFQKVVQLDYSFPEGFDITAQDLVKKLLVREPNARLGHDNKGGFAALKRHKFFTGIDWNNLHAQKAPVIAPSLAPSDFPERSGSISVAGLARIEPGLDDRQLTRLMGLSLQGDDFAAAATDSPKEDGITTPLDNMMNIPLQPLTLASSSTSNPSPPPVPSASHPLKTSSRTTVLSRQSTRVASLIDVTDDEKRERLAKQSRSNEWHRFAGNNLILKQGFVDKKKGLFPRRRMLLLTTGPHLYYADPNAMVLKGEIPWSAELRPEAKTFKIFFIHTPNRTYYLIDPSNNAVQWCEAIEEVYTATYGPRTTAKGGGVVSSPGESLSTTSSDMSTSIQQTARRSSRGEEGGN